eukprot:372685_1
MSTNNNSILNDNKEIKTLRELRDRYANTIDKYNDEADENTDIVTILEELYKCHTAKQTLENLESKEDDLRKMDIALEKGKKEVVFGQQKVVINKKEAETIFEVEEEEEKIIQFDFEKELGMAGYQPATAINLGSNNIYNHVEAPAKRSINGEYLLVDSLIGIDEDDIPCVVDEGDLYEGITVETESILSRGVNVSLMKESASLTRRYKSSDQGRKLKLNPKAEMCLPKLKSDVKNSLVGHMGSSKKINAIMSIPGTNITENINIGRNRILNKLKGQKRVRLQLDSSKDVC